jgi:hypothetical protein
MVKLEVRKIFNTNNKKNSLLKQRIRIYTEENMNKDFEELDITLNMVSKIYDKFKNDDKYKNKSISIYGQGVIYICIFDKYKNLCFEAENYLDGETAQKPEIKNKLNKFLYIDVCIS